jgi:glycosyltransferase involved in cell wall biosynthesis
MTGEKGLSHAVNLHPIDISIVIPFYKGEKVLPRLAESLVKSYLASSRALFVEMIVIVDSVESDTSQISSGLNEIIGPAEKFSVVVRKNEQNLGVAQSRMNGQQLSAGKFISFIDQDDYTGLSYFSVLEKNLSGNFDFFLVNGYIEFEQQKIRRPVFYFPVRLSFNKIARVNILITPGLLIFNRSRITCNFRQISAKHPGSDDWACYLDLLSQPALRYKYIGEKLLHYVVHTQNYHQNKANFIISQVRTIEYFHRKYPRNVSVGIKLSSLEFRLKRHLSLLKFSKLTLRDIAGFFSFIFIELFIIQNFIWLLWHFRLTLHKNKLSNH